MGRGIYKRQRGPEKVPLGIFVDQANQNLDLANNPDTPFEETISAANALAERIQRVRNGRLEIQPPIALADLDSFQERAGTIIALGEQATQSLTHTGAANRAPESGATFSGTGSLAKT